MTEVEPAASESKRGAPDELPHCHLLLEEGENKRLLKHWLEPNHRITNGESPDPIPADFDFCIVDRTNFAAHRSQLARRKRAADPSFLPVLLLAPSSDEFRTDPAVWDLVDDIVETPVGKAELAARIGNLADRRRTARRLAERESALERTISELELKDRAMDAAPVGVTILDADDEQRSIIYANAAFERISGYDREEVLGRSMRFLEGPDTDREAVGTLVSALEAGETAGVTLIHYRRNGSRFWNRVEVAPVHDERGELIAHVSFQTDITDETVREQRLSVLNRVMRHNLSNDLNVIRGYASLLEEAADPAERQDALEHILASAGDLEKLSRTASWIEKVLGRCRGSARPSDITAQIARVCDDLAQRHDADIHLDVDGGPWYVRGSCIDEALFELVENAVKHSGSGPSTVEVAVCPHWGLEDHVMVTVADDGPGIPENTVEVLAGGVETQLNHGDGLGLWLVYWVVTLLGGSIEVDLPERGGTAVRLTLPVCDPESS